MDSPPLPPPTSLEDSSKKEENSFIFDELDFLIQRDGSPPSLFELLADFVGDESSCLAEQDSQGFKKVARYQVAIDNAKQKQKAISRKPVASVSKTQNGATNVLPLKNEA
ncbi:hypothetical protein RIF29_15439 [Crotalaria pallida]|uniref:Uncharacterized protein n=1 Tax=Crotalaria pallida TaxID=3830 RepID=A0AAN9FF38_CROPI